MKTTGYANYWPALILLCLLPLATARAQSIVFQDLGILPGPFPSTTVQALSDDGNSVIGSSGGRTFRWTEEGGMQELDDLGSFFSDRGISGDGAVIVGSVSPSAARLIVEEGMPSILQVLSNPPLPPGSPGLANARAGDASWDGSVVVGIFDHNDATLGEINAFRWENGTSQLITDKRTVNSPVVSNDGSVVAGTVLTDDGAQLLFRWTEGGGTQYYDVFPERGTVWDISGDGTTIVGEAVSGGGAVSVPFRWTEAAGYEGHDVLGLPTGSAYSVSEDGSVIAGLNFPLGPYLWDSTNGLRGIQQLLDDSSVDTTGWTLSRPWISDDATTLVGRGNGPDGNPSAWLARSCLNPLGARRVCESRIIWEAPISGEFENADNWLPDVVPGAGDTAVFSRVGTYTVLLEDNHALAGIEIRGGDVNVTLEGTGFAGKDIEATSLNLGLDNTDDVLLTLDKVFLDLGSGVANIGAVEGGHAQLKTLPQGLLDAGTINVGMVEEGHILMQGGGISATNLRIADQKGNGSSVMMQDGRLEVRETLEIGVGKRAEFKVAQNGRVEMSGANATTTIDNNSTLEISGEGSLWEQPNSGAILIWGSLRIAEKGAASFKELSIVPTSGDKTGSVEVLANSTLTIGDTLHVGAFQGGFIEVKPDGELTAKDVNVGQFHSAVTSANEVARAIVNDGDATFSGNVTIGSLESNVIDTIKFGAEFVVDQEGFVTVNGTGKTTLLPGGKMEVSNGGFWQQENGDLSVQSGGVVVGSGGTIQVDRLDVQSASGRPPGLMAIAVNGVAIARDTVTIGGSGEGQVALLGGEIEAEEEFRVLTGGVLAGSGTARARHFDVANGSVSAAVQQVLSPARGVPNPIGKLVLDGDYTQSDGGTMLLDVAGSGEGEFDVIEITGDAVIDGPVVVSFVRGFAPKAGQGFGTLVDIAGAADVTGAQFIVQNLAGDFEYDVTLMENGFMLTALTDGTFRQAIPGDYNNSGQVEQADLDLVLLNWGASATRIPAGWINDLPDGNIDQNELDGVLLKWGNSAAAASVAGAVPEPSTLLLALVILGLIRRTKPTM